MGLTWAPRACRPFRIVGPETRNPKTRTLYTKHYTQNSTLEAIKRLGSDYYFTEICSGSEAGSYLRLIDFVYHSTLGLRVIKKKKTWDLSQKTESTT